ncbi:hypothetical protein Vretifemale_2332 [Volvox reticuliferus]|nr:hypothetical protein Vretifemale_2332 [Volvox reticuliferus]
MVADITVRERKAEELRNSILPTSRLQLSFGAHVLVTMFTFWALAYYGSKLYLSYDELWAGMLGALGLTAGLLLETLLLIVRSNRPVPLEERCGCGDTSKGLPWTGIRIAIAVGQPQERCPPSKTRFPLRV